MKSNSSLNQKFLTKTADIPLPAPEQTKVEAAKFVLAGFASAAEEDDEKKQLYTLDTSNRGKQVKGSVFSGEVGENFF